MCLAQLRRCYAGLNEVPSSERLLSDLYKSFVSVTFETAINAKFYTYKPRFTICLPHF